tara:strand:- start:74 stop:274 length:201 start_codon:yes stop_codon:yes gene_type:complete
MIKVIVHFGDHGARRSESYDILTYLRGDKYWQFLCLDGTLKIIPDSSVEMIEIINEQAPKMGEKEE